MDEEEIIRRVEEIDVAIAKVKKKIEDYKAAVIKGRKIVEELEHRRAKLTTGKEPKK